MLKVVVILLVLLTSNSFPIPSSVGVWKNYFSSTEVQKQENGYVKAQDKFSHDNKLFSEFSNDEGKMKTRRGLLRTIFSLTTVSQLTSSKPSLAMYENAPVFEGDKILLPSGVSIQDLKEGSGEEVSEGKRVNMQWALKRSNGYFIDSSSNNDGVPFIFTVGSTKGQRAIVGLDEGIRGVKVGGVRRVVIPPSLAYVEGLNDGMPGPIPGGFGPKQRIRRVMENRMDVPDESFIIDLKVTRVQ